jgi:hypothetical protein
MALAFLQDQVSLVSTVEELKAAIAAAKPGATIAVAAGVYEGGFKAEGLHGTKESPIRIAGADPKNPPVFRGGGTGIHLSKVSHIEVSNLRIESCRFNGINVDDGGDFKNPSRGITLKNLVVTDLPKGNHDGIKLSGVVDFRVERCLVERWGGSGIDMVGCHRGTILDSSIRQGGDSGIQAKGGSSEIRIERCVFVDYGQRGVNLGGSTGFEFFRPPLASIPAGRRFEARDLKVLGSTFVRGTAPLAFVGVDGAMAEFNTLYHPGRWAMRILQETRDPGFVPTRNGTFARNLVVFRSEQWSEGGVNVGDGTHPASFRFDRNFWFCSDLPGRSRPRLPHTESGGTYGVDPHVRLLSGDAIQIGPKSPALEVGAHAYTRSEGQGR